MFRFLYPYRMVLLVLILSTVLLGGLLASCNSLAPIMSYQGRITNASGQPLNGSYSFMFRLFPAATGGTAIYTETKNITVNNGLFDTTVGPSTLVAGLSPEMLSQPLWLDVTINGETLTPRQQLLGAPYAFTLMPGAVISSTISTASAGSNIKAVLTIVNKEVAANSPLPVLRIEGLGGMEIVGSDNSDGLAEAGVIYSHKSSTHSDIRFASNDEYYIDLDNDNNSTSSLRIRNGEKQEICRINEAGDLTCIGTITGGVLSGSGETNTLYSMQSPEVWIEDFGSGTLANGIGQVIIDPLFAATVNPDDYHVFVTPLGDCSGLYVTDKTATGFEVRELGGGTANIAFDYRIVAKRLGYETKRLDPLEAEVDEEEK